MRSSQASQSRPRSTELLRKQIYVVVAAVSGLSQLAMILTRGIQGTHPSWTSVYVMLTSGVFVLLLQRGTFNLHQIDLGVLSTASLGVLAHLVQAARVSTPPEPSLYSAGVFLYLIAFNVLPLRWAAWYAAGLYLLFGGLTLTRPGDPALLIKLALIVLLIAYFSVFGERVREERAGADSYQQLALTDPLTGLENRRAMYDRLVKAHLRSQSGETATLLLIDLDHFKAVNDVHGHPVGDQVLKRTAAVLTGALRHGDAVARWGGEEFLMLVEAADLSVGAKVSERVLEALRTAPMPMGLQVTASCGVCWSAEVATVTEWLSSVDERLYAAKQGGRDQVCANWKAGGLAV